VKNTTFGSSCHRRATADKKKKILICIKTIKNYSADCMHAYPFM